MAHSARTTGMCSSDCGNLSAPSSSSFHDTTSQPSFGSATETGSRAAVGRILGETSAESTL